MRAGDRVRPLDDYRVEDQIGYYDHACLYVHPTTRGTVVAMGTKTSEAHCWVSFDRYPWVYTVFACNNLVPVHPMEELAAIGVEQDQKKEESMSIIIKAAEFARDAHMGQKRDGGQAYIIHPARVAKRISDMPGLDADVIAAAWLHDTLEDCPSVTRDRLAVEFGDRVTNLVIELTNEYTSAKYPKLNRDARKTKECKRLEGVSKEAKMIKMADRIDNLNDMDLSTEKGRDFARTYVAESESLMVAVGGAHEDLKKELGRQISRLRAKL